MPGPPPVTMALFPSSSPIASVLSPFPTLVDGPTLGATTPRFGARDDRRHTVHSYPKGPIRGTLQSFRISSSWAMLRYSTPSSPYMVPRMVERPDALTSAWKSKRFHSSARRGRWNHRAWSRLASV